MCACIFVGKMYSTCKCESYYFPEFLCKMFFAPTVIEEIGVEVHAEEVHIGICMVIIFIQFQAKLKCLVVCL
jgi:hypothetical protein